MQAAFDLGADVVELDVKLTKDNKLAVFHDFTLEYRTDGTGNVSDYTMADEKLDGDTDIRRMKARPILSGVESA